MNISRGLREAESELRRSACHVSCAPHSPSADAAAVSPQTIEEFRTIVERGLEASPIGQVLLDQSVLGWGEFELEVMRD